MLPLCLKREAVLLAIFFASDDNLVKVLRKLLPNMVRLFMMLYESSGITAVIPKRTLNSTFLTNQPEIKIEIYIYIDYDSSCIVSEDATFSLFGAEEGTVGSLGIINDDVTELEREPVGTLENLEEEVDRLGAPEVE